MPTPETYQVSLSSRAGKETRKLERQTLAIKSRRTSMVISSVLALGLLCFVRPVYALYTLLATSLWLVIALVLISKDEADERRKQDSPPSPDLK